METKTQEKFDEYVAAVKLNRRSKVPTVCNICGKDLTNTPEEEYLTYDNTNACKEHKVVEQLIAASEDPAMSKTEALETYMAEVIPTDILIVEFFKNKEYELAMDNLPPELRELVEPTFVELLYKDVQYSLPTFKMYNFNKLMLGLKELYGSDTMIVWNWLFPGYHMRDDYGIILPECGTILVLITM